MYCHLYRLFILEQALAFVRTGTAGVGGEAWSCRAEVHGVGHAEGDAPQTAGTRHALACRYITLP